MSQIDTSDWKQSDVRAWCDAISEYTNDWQGVPVPLGDDMPLVLNPTHPLFDFYRDAESVVHTCTDDDVREDEHVVNHWFSRQRQCDVYIVDRGGRRAQETLRAMLSPRQWMHYEMRGISAPSIADRLVLRDVAAVEADVRLPSPPPNHRAVAARQGRGGHGDALPGGAVPAPDRLLPEQLGGLHGAIR